MRRTKAFQKDQCEDQRFSARSARRSAAFTFIETLVALTILIGLLVLAAPVLVDFQESSTLIAERDQLVGLLRRARTLALANKNGSNHGVHITNTSAILFQGSSYAARDSAYDEETSRSSSVVITGATTTVFTSLSGAATSTAGTTTITLTRNERTQAVTFNNEGGISW